MKKAEREQLTAAGVIDDYGPRTAMTIMRHLYAVAKVIERDKVLEVRPWTEKSDAIRSEKQILTNAFLMHAEQVPKEKFVDWCKMIGALRVPRRGKKGNIHITLFDNGLLSDFFKKYDEEHDAVDYKTKSRFIYNDVFFTDRETQDIKGHIDLHVFSVRELTQPALLSIRELVSKAHDKTGRYMMHYSFDFFTVPQPDLEVKVEEYADGYYRFDVQWLAEQVALWEKQN